jgi:hypothetical protein
MGILEQRILRATKRVSDRSLSCIMQLQRKKKLKVLVEKKGLINSFNHQWKFLNYELLGEWPPTNPVHRKKE